MDEYRILIAFGLTIFAGLSTGIGSTMAFFSKQTNTKFLSFSLGFSAGVMIYVSMIKLFAEAHESLAGTYGERSGMLLTAISFFCGILLIAVIDKLVPSYENPHELHRVADLSPRGNSMKSKRLMRMGIFSALAIAIHNFPEGLAIFASSLHKPTLGITVAIAIAIHNIPEGIAISVPIYHATNSKKKAFIYSFFSGFAEPLGALIGYLILLSFINDFVLGVLFAFVAGIMVFISLDELLPAAIEFGEHHLSIYGLIAGMMIMAISLLLMM
jgi:ZIP family zinc transporter